MKQLALSILLVGAFGATATYAAAPPGAPSGSMGMCNDGTYSRVPRKRAPAEATRV